MAERLKKESSPYLRQHADNPVDWHPWGEEAFARARAEDKPVFISIGYAACHWCHVMAHESFEDETTAALMNELYVCIKIDREERPDVDAVYMAAIHAAGEGGGWPLSAFCDSSGRPFFLGTYFPPEERYGRPSFKNVLTTMARVFKEKREQVEDNANVLLNSLRELDLRHRAEAAARGGELSASILVTAGRRLAQISDPKNGGFGTRPKFPSSSAHAVLARAGRMQFGQPGQDAFLKQCDGMANGGIYDHLAGGFARYSVDDKWLVPHFEKMLSDNAQLLEIYGDAYAMTERPLYRNVIVETVGWLEREMLDPAGGLYSSLDADSEGQEGKFYVWAPGEIAEVLGADAAEFSRAYGVTKEGNFEGATILSRVAPLGDQASEARLRAMRGQLLTARARRVRPGTDDKILAGWNGLCITGLLRAYAATGHEPARALAEKVAAFLWDKMMTDGGKQIARVYHAGSARLSGTIDDFAFVGQAFLDLAEVAESDSWWQRGVTLLEQIEMLFYREEDGAPIFYMSGDEDAKLLVHRPESHQDGAIPSGAAVTVDAWLRLARAADRPGLFDKAERYLRARIPAAENQPFSVAHLLLAFDRYLHGAELVITAGTNRDKLVSEARRAYQPVTSIYGPWLQSDLLSGKTPSTTGQAHAYLCKGQTCQPGDTRLNWGQMT